MRTKLSRNAFACVLAGIILLAAPMAAQAKKVALIIGIAHYQNMRDPGDTTSDLPIGGLRGPKNDALAIRRVIIQRYGFKPENVRILLNEQATKANVLHALNNWLVQKVDKDDVVLLYISGHGTQVLSHGLDPNRLWCQAFVCYDYAPVNSAANAPLDKRNIIINKDFEKVLNKISEKTNNITFIADCCYSGGLTRDAFPGLYGSRWLPPATVDVKRAKEAPNAPAVMDENDEANDNVTLIGACADLEQASEVQMKDGLWHGVMSYYLTKTLAQTPSNLSYGELMGIVKQDVQSKFRQTPQLITIHSDWPVLGGLSSPAAETVAATTTTTTTTTTIVSHPTASVQATAPSTTFSATATTIPSPRSDVLYVRVLSSRRSAGGLTSIINGFQNIKCTQNAGMADRIIALTRREGKVQADLTFRDGAVDATVEGASPKQIAESLRPFLQKAWLIKMVSSIRSSDPTLDPALSVNADAPKDLRIRPVPLANPGLPILYTGETTSFTVTPAHACYISLVDIGTDGSMVVLVPNDIYSSGEKLHAGQSYIIPDKRMGFEIDVDPPTGTEMVVAIASRKPLDWQNMPLSLDESKGGIGVVKNLTDEGKLFEVRRKSQVGVTTQTATTTTLTSPDGMLPANGFGIAFVMADVQRGT